MADDPHARPVHTLESALDALDALPTPGDPRRGPLRQRAANAARALPAGSLHPQRARLLGEALARLADPRERILPRATLPVPPRVGTTSWLSCHDDVGAVLEVKLERLGATQRPWAELWPEAGADAAAEAAASRAWAWAAEQVAFRPLSPLRGWHRLVTPGLPAGAAPRFEGGSLGAALSMMLLSVWLEQPLDPTVVVTGDLDADGHVVLPEGASVSVKVAAVARERASVKRVLVPAGLSTEHPGLEVVEVRTLGEVARHMGLDLRRPVHPATLPAWIEAVDEARWLDRTRGASVPVLRGRLETLFSAWPSIEASLADPGSPPWAVWTARLDLLALLCSYRAHHGEPVAAAQVAPEIDELAATRRARGEAMPPGLFARVRNVQASLMLDAHRFEAARLYAGDAAAAAERAGDAVEAARIASTRGRIEAHARRDAEALPLLDEALARFERAAPWEANICRCYRVGVLGRLGRAGDAKRALAEAREANAAEPGMSEGWRTSNALYLAYEGLKLALVADRPGLAEALAGLASFADDAVGTPWPRAGVYARAVEASLLGDARAAAAEWHRRLHALEATAAASVVSGMHGRACAALLADALERGETPDPSWIAATRTWLSLLPDTEESPLREPRARSLALLETSAPERSAALRALLDLEVY